MSIKTATRYIILAKCIFSTAIGRDDAGIRTISCSFPRHTAPIVSKGPSAEALVHIIVRSRDSSPSLWWSWRYTHQPMTNALREHSRQSLQPVSATVRQVWSALGSAILKESRQTSPSYLSCGGTGGTGGKKGDKVLHPTLQYGASPSRERERCLFRHSSAVDNQG